MKDEERRTGKGKGRKLLHFYDDKFQDLHALLKTFHFEIVLEKRLVRRDEIRRDGPPTPSTLDSSNGNIGQFGQELDSD